MAGSDTDGVTAARGRVGLPAPIAELAGRDWDAVVVGGGHNGLTAAAYLAWDTRRFNVRSASAHKAVATRRANELAAARSAAALAAWDTRRAAFAARSAAAFAAWDTRDAA